MTETQDKRPAKSETAFRTIGELSADLGVPQHVLRYWEQRFTQLRPVQRAGKRRYYRPDDVTLAKRIHRLLTVEGYTVRGVQQLLGKPPTAEPAPAPAPAPVPAVGPPAAPAPMGDQALADTDRRALMRVRDMLAVALAED